MLNCKQCGCLVRESRYAKHPSTRCPRTKCKGKPKSRGAPRFAASLRQSVRDKKRCKYCGQLISITAYQQHLEQVHATQNCKCSHCGLIVQLPKYSHHISKECLGALTRNCKYCGDPVVMSAISNGTKPRDQSGLLISRGRAIDGSSHTRVLLAQVHMLSRQRVTGRQTRFTVATAVESQCQDLPLVTVVATSREV